jgi:flagellar motor switch protein FliN
VTDDLLKPEEIEALLKSAGPSGGSGAGGGSTAGGAHAVPASQGASRPAAPKPTTKQKSPTERLLEQAEAGLAAAVAPNLNSPTGIPQELGNAAPFQFQAFDSTGDRPGDGIGLSALQDVELDLRIELGRTELLVEEVLQLREGSVVPLNKLAGDPVDILVNGRLVARGEVLVLNDNFCVRIAEIVAPTL